MNENLHTKGDLMQRQALPLNAKILMSKSRSREWFNYWDGDVYIAFSGGKDSTVLAHIVKSIYPDMPLVFANTGLEYPEIQAFARKMGALFVRPKMMFSEVISKYGYPVISKEVAQSIEEARTKATDKSQKWTMARRAEFFGTRINPKNGEIAPFQKTRWLPLARGAQFKISSKCCSVMKKGPMKAYQSKTKRKPYVGTLAEESRLREMAWIKHGCNLFDSKNPSSQPLSFWTEQDVLQYIKQNGIEIASVYGDIVSTDRDGYCYDSMLCGEGKLKCTGCQRTGCIFCGFGAYLDKDIVTRFQRLAATHPKQYEYCMNGGQWVDNPKYDPALPKYDGDWENWNPKKIWVPSKEGLGMRKVYNDINQMYGHDFIRFE